LQNGRSLTGSLSNFASRKRKNAKIITRWSQFDWVNL